MFILFINTFDSKGNQYFLRFLIGSTVFHFLKYLAIHKCDCDKRQPLSVFIGLFLRTNSRLRQGLTWQTILILIDIPDVLPICI
jgi:hypothetical protein